MMLGNPTRSLCILGKHSASQSYIPVFLPLFEGPTPVTLFNILPSFKVPVSKCSHTER